MKTRLLVAYYIQKQESQKPCGDEAEHGQQELLAWFRV